MAYHEMKSHAEELEREINEMTTKQIELVNHMKLYRGQINNDTMGKTEDTKREEELLRENRDLRIKVKQQEQEILDQISHSGVWVKQLKAKSQQVIDLLNKYEPDPYESNA
jgi:hypothetical protein